MKCNINIIVNIFVFTVACLLSCLSHSYEEVEIIGISPNGPVVSKEKNAPFSGTYINESRINNSKEHDSTKLLLSEVPGVSINSVQNGVFRMTSFIGGIQLRHWWESHKVYRFL